MLPSVIRYDLFVAWLLFECKGQKDIAGGNHYVLYRVYPISHRRRVNGASGFEGEKFGAVLRVQDEEIRTVGTEQ